VTWTIENWRLIAEAAVQHVVLVGSALTIALAISLVLGIASARRPRLYAVIVAVTATLYTVPALALFALLIPLMGLGAWPAISGLVLYSLLILTRNTATGLREVPAEALDAATGMGFDPWRRFMQIELPLALPAIVAGIRIAVVNQISIATVAAYIHAGGLGTIILTGIEQDFPEKIIVGAGLAAGMAILADAGLKWSERRLRARSA
jgi:osmoprotectant transport system permease protein